MTRKRSVRLETTMKIAILDDYQNVALKLADWSAISKRAEVTVFNDHLSDPDAVVRRLEPFDIVCVMRERTPLRRDAISRLPKLIVSTGSRNPAGIDLEAAKERGIEVANTGYRSTPTIEMTWTLILASVRNVVNESVAVRSGGWQQGIGEELEGKTLGVLGLGNVGEPVARIGSAFGMKIIAWSQNMTAEIAQSVGAEFVSKEQLFERSDILTIHVILSERTRGLVGASLLNSMKPSARLVNTSRGPIVDEAALIDVLQRGRIAGAAIDVFGQEPLPKDHPFRKLPNVVATPHIGYVARGLYETFYGDTVNHVERWLDSAKR
jgi:phosphoglycerate dehydrogenase-like enzyme